MVDLADIGRARPSKFVGDILEQQNRRRRVESLEQIRGAQAGLMNERMLQLRRKAQFEEEERARMNRPVNVDDVLDTFYGGREGAMGQFALKLGKAYGLYEEGEDGRWSNIRNMQEGLQLLMQPGTGENFIRAGLRDANKNIATIEARLAEKPDDQKLQEALQMHKQARLVLKSKFDEANKLVQEQAEMDQDKAELDLDRDEHLETVRHNKAQEEIDRIRAQRSGSGASENLTQKEGETAEDIMLYGHYQDKLSEGMSPNDIYREGIRMKDDATIWPAMKRDPVSKQLVKAAVKLPAPNEVLGKRGQAKAILELGELRDDMLEIQGLLRDPDVIADFKGNSAEFWKAVKAGEMKAPKDGTMGQVRESVSNRINAWLSEKGVSNFKSDKSLDMFVLISQAAAISRHKFMGTAVTVQELKPSRRWLLTGDESYKMMLAKADRAAKESDQHFRRFLDSYKHRANMSEYYDVFGISRFGGALPQKPDAPKKPDAPTEKPIGEMSDEELMNMRM